MDKNLPIKIVLPRKNDVKSKPAGGGHPKFFGIFDNKVQTQIIHSLKAVNNYYSDFFKETHNTIPATALLIMKDEACAKSHTPDALLGNNSIIGARDLNQFYIKITNTTLGESISIAAKAESEKVQANITAIKNIIPIDPQSKISSFLQKTIRTDFEDYKRNIKKLNSSISITMRK